MQPIRPQPRHNLPSARGTTPQRQPAGSPRHFQQQKKMSGATIAGIAGAIAAGVIAIVAVVFLATRETQASMPDAGGDAAPDGVDEDEYTRATETVRLRFRVYFAKVGDSPQDLSSSFPETLTPESRAKWLKRIDSAHPDYTAIAREPTLKAGKEWAAWASGPGKGMPKSVVDEKWHEVFGGCCTTIGEEIERVEGVR